MRLLATSPLARDALGALIIIGVMMVLVGIVHLVDVLLGGRKWLPKMVVNYVLPAFFFLYWIGIVFAAIIFGNIMEVLTLPDRNIWLGIILFAAFIFGVYSLLYLLSIQMLWVLGSQSFRVKPGPLLKWRRLAWLSPAYLALFIFFGFLAGFNWPADLDQSIFSVVRLPLVGWPFQFIWLLMGIFFGLGIPLLVLVTSWTLRQMSRIPASRFGTVGAVLLGCGSVIILLAFLLVP
ncbi:MAG TPA: hypothetical protein VH540_08210 [Ktedonobacterales bacterium]